MVKIYKLQFTILQLELWRYLCIHAGEAYNARTLAKALQVSSPAIAKALPKLEQQGMITLQKEAGRLSIELNRDNPKIISLKRAENLKLLYESGIVEFLYDSFPGTVIILFGSYSLGEDIFSSDIDIAVIGARERKLDLNPFQKVLEKAINLNSYPSFELDRHLRNNILNGIVLKGSVDI